MSFEWTPKYDMVEGHSATAKSEKVTITIKTPKGKTRLTPQDVVDALKLAQDRAQNKEGAYKSLGDQ